VIRRRFLALAAGGATQLCVLSAHGAAPPPFVMTSITLYLPDEEFRRRGPSVQALTDYINALVEMANRSVAATPKIAGASGALVVAMKPPAKSRLWVMTGDPSQEAVLASVLDAPFEAVPAPTVRGLNAFAINFDVRGGGRRLPQDYPLPVPEAWRQVMPRGGGLLPDTPLQALWPD
jgi:hypothetical protein